MVNVPIPLGTKRATVESFSSIIQARANGSIAFSYDIKSVSADIRYAGCCRLTITLASTLSDSNVYGIAGGGTVTLGLEY